LILKAVASYSL
jgi:hypothetical protein